nr:MAG TPA: nucelotide kinase [Caudoviricetes sp.]
MNKKRYIVAIVTEEKGTLYLSSWGSDKSFLVKDKTRAFGYRDVDLAKVAFKAGKKLAERQGLTVVSTAVLEDYEHFSIGDWSKAKPQKVELSGDFYVTPSRNKKPGPEDRITPEPTECNLRVEDNSVDSPAHYQLAEGMEAIDVIDQVVGDPASFYRGNAIKCLLRAGRKGDAKQDLEKARWYIDREINHRES